MFLTDSDISDWYMLSVPYLSVYVWTHTRTSTHDAASDVVAEMRYFCCAGSTDKTFMNKKSGITDHCDSPYGLGPYEYF